MKKTFLLMVIVVHCNFFFSMSLTKDYQNIIKPDKHYIGEFFGGGIIFYLYDDDEGNEHGLIASLYDLSSSCFWTLKEISVPNCNSLWDGSANTKAILSSGIGKPDEAAGICDRYENDGYSDWYLPAIDEMKLLFNNRFLINKFLEEDNNPSTIGLVQSYYWSSTQNTASHAWYWDSGGGFANDGSKKLLSKSHVRAVPSF